MVRRRKVQEFINGFRSYYNRPSLPPAWGYMGAFVGVIVAFSVILQLFSSEPDPQVPTVPLTPTTAPATTLPTGTSPTVGTSTPVGPNSTVSTPEDVARAAALAAVTGEWEGINVVDMTDLPEPRSSKPHEVIEVLPIDAPSGATAAFWVTVAPADASGPPFPVELALLETTVVSVSVP